MKLRRKIAAAGEAALAKSDYVTVIDALLATGWLTPTISPDGAKGTSPTSNA